MNQIASAILAASISAIIGSIVTIFVNNLLEERKFPKAEKDRIKSLNGNWNGKFKQFVGNNEYRELDVSAVLTRKFRKVKGNATYTFVDGKHTELKLYNGLFDGHILKIEYVGNLGIFHKGSMIVEMNPNGDTFNGQFIGYSPNFKQIINGFINMSKQN